MKSFVIIGPGRAGRSFEQALSAVGWLCKGVYGRGEGIPSGADLYLITVPDRSIVEAAERVPVGDHCVAHACGSLGLDVLSPHGRRAVIHPFVPLPDPRKGAERLLSGAFFRVEGDALAYEVVKELGGQALRISREDAVWYHCLGVIGANLLAGLLAYVAHQGQTIGVPRAAFGKLAAGSVEDFSARGISSLTGPVTRGDEATLARQRGELARRDPEFLPVWDSLVALTSKTWRQEVGLGEAGDAPRT
jgi:predicted short-subunit dehydrogenase-like oxidoreductase (DUF2520 family)